MKCPRIGRILSLTLKTEAASLPPPDSSLPLGMTEVYSMHEEVSNHYD